MEGTFGALVPPILAIIVSLITKEVNISLLTGIIIGALIYCGLNPFSTVRKSTFCGFLGKIYERERIV